MENLLSTELLNKGIMVHEGSVYLHISFVANTLLRSREWVSLRVIDACDWLMYDNEAWLSTDAFLDLLFYIAFDMPESTMEDSLTKEAAKRSLDFFVQNGIKASI